MSTTISGSCAIVPGLITGPYKEKWSPAGAVVTSPAGVVAGGRYAPTAIHVVSPRLRGDAELGSLKGCIPAFAGYCPLRTMGSVAKLRRRLQLRRLAGPPAFFERAERCAGWCISGDRGDRWAMAGAIERRRLRVSGRAGRS